MKKDEEQIKETIEKFFQELENHEFTIWENIKYHLDRIFNIRRHLFHLRLFFQKVFRGWSDEETWNMDITFIQWFLPRLKRFKEVSECYPSEYEDPDQWFDEIQEIIDKMEFFLNDLDNRYREKEFKEIINWFHKNIKYLWW